MGVTDGRRVSPAHSRSGYRLQVRLTGALRWGALAKGLARVLALVLGLVINSPTAGGIAALGKAMQALQERLRKAGGLGAVLLAIAVVVAGAKAQFKGSGAINGVGEYGFLLTATDGQVNGGGGADKFRIKIWDQATSQIIYDNQMGADDAADPATDIGGGAIVIHK